MEATTAEAPGAATSSRARVRARFAVVLLLLGLAVASVPGLAAGDAFRPGTVIYSVSRGPFTWVAAQRPTQNAFTVDVTTPRVEHTFRIYPRSPWRSSLPDLVLHETGWTAAAVALLALAPLFAWWRRAGLTFGRVAGVASSAAAAASVCLLVLVPRADTFESAGGVWWTVPLGAVLMGAAFAVAPAPVPRRDD